MGDRGSLGFRSGHSECVWLYTHWAGAVLPTLAARGIEAARPRWRDESYATRMALTELIGGITEDAGWGIAAWVTPENEHPALIVDFVECNVRLIEPDTADGWSALGTDDRLDLFDTAPRATFEQFLSTEEDPVHLAWQAWHR